MHRQERHIESDEHNPEGNAPQPIGQLLSTDQRIEVIDASNDRKDDTTDHNIVHVCHDEVRVVRLEVERGKCNHHARQPATHEDHQAPH